MFVQEDYYICSHGMLDALTEQHNSHRMCDYSTIVEEEEKIKHTIEVRRNYNNDDFEIERGVYHFV